MILKLFNVFLSGAIGKTDSSLLIFSKLYKKRKIYESETVIFHKNYLNIFRERF